MLKYTLMSILLVAGCSPEIPTSVDALADATRDQRAAHAAALAEDGGPKSILTGQALIATLDAAF